MSVRCIRTALAWGFYWAGHMVDGWFVGYDDGAVTNLACDVYQWLMRRSRACQGDCPGPWR